ncbi:hypothetical protein B0A52_00905 [Exophiala mesophila]|uniref:Small ribosomal subunit protein mS35 mitochondrial conserved domain-containing protein n=1 Tax=Exophiala mesophila TaxID=212818 RepID=A0A438NII4_EXOME|nr:hypothetical protein B0A52_00905 [Exophiala mesophila]
MATSARHLCRSLLQVSHHLPVKRKGPPACLHGPKWSCKVPPFRQLSSTTFRRAANDPTDGQSGSPTSLQDDSGPRGENENAAAAKPGKKAQDNEMVDELEELLFDTTPPPIRMYETPNSPASAEDLTEDELALMKELAKDAPQEFRGDPVGLYNHLLAEAESMETEEGMDKSVLDDFEREFSLGMDDLDIGVDRLDRRSIGWHARDEDDEFAQTEDADDEHDDSDITSVAHSELEVHREIREYTRVTAWDMPLLQNFVKPFEPPTEKQPLRFRYTTYLGETHPAARKVVLQFCPKDLPGLTAAQQLKLLKLVGPRYNPDTEIVKMSCEKFEAPAQNKRYLADLVTSLIDEAKNGKDTLEDIPLDLRHHRSKKVAKFPQEWKLDTERVKQLLSQRKEQQLLQESQGTKVLDGREYVYKQVEAARQRVQQPVRTLNY